MFTNTTPTCTVFELLFFAQNSRLKKIIDFLSLLLHFQNFFYLFFNENKKSFEIEAKETKNQ